MNEAFRQYMDEMMTRLREKIEETQNTLRYAWGSLTRAVCHWCLKTQEALVVCGQKVAVVEVGLTPP